MPHYATLKDYQFKDRLDDIRGETLYGVEGDKLGKIDDVIFEHGSGDVKYVVVDTGGWLSSHKFLVPAERIHSFDRDPNALQVDLLKEHIERYFPPYDEKVVDREEDWREYEGRYNRATRDNRVWEEGPVLHKRDSTHTITPEAADLPAGEGEGIRDAEVEPHRLAGRFPSTMPGGGKLDMVPEGTRPVERSVSYGNESFVPPEGEQSFTATREFGNLDVSVEHDPQESGLHERSLRHRHTEGKVEDISSSRNFRPAEVKPPAPLGSMGEDIEPIAEPNAGRPAQPIVEVGAQKGPGPVVREHPQEFSGGDLRTDLRVNSSRNMRNTGNPAAGSQDSITVPERADTGEHRLQDRNMNQVSHPVENVRGTGRVPVSMDDMHSRPERWSRFEDLLKKNRVDIEAKCAQCAPARDRKVG